MPTNPFQHLIFLIERQLQGTASVVVESTRRRELASGRKREIDILIETDLGGHLLRVAIECIDHGRPATVEWVERMWGKYQSLGISHVILVSRTGFTPGASEKATLYGYEALTLSDASELDWVGALDRIRSVELTTFAPQVRHVSVIVAGNSTPPPLTAERLDEFTIHAADGRQRSTLREQIEAAVSDEGTRRWAEGLFTADGTQEAKLELHANPGDFLRSRAGHCIRVEKLVVTVEFARETAQIPLVGAAYVRAKVAFGSGAVAGNDFTFVAVEREGVGPRLGAEIRGPEADTWTLRPVLSSDDRPRVTDNS